MDRIGNSELATHLEVALMMAPPDTLSAIQGEDRHRRNKAIGKLAEHLTARLDCYNITLSDEMRQRVDGAETDAQLLDGALLADGNAS